MSVYIPNSPSPFGSRGFYVGPEMFARIDGDYIVWEGGRHVFPSPVPDSTNRPMRDRRVPFASLLEGFTKLDGKTSDQLLGFARKYGHLGLCKHDFAIGHRTEDFNKRCHETVMRPRKETARESVEAWRRYIRRAKGILAVAEKLHRGQRAKDDDWAWLFEGVPLSPDAVRRAHNPAISFLAGQRILLKRAGADTLPEQKRFLSYAVNHWLDECEVVLAVYWLGAVIDLHFAPSNPLGNVYEIGLLGAIGAELLWAVTQRDARVRCSACPCWYDPKEPCEGRKGPGRWPRAGENHYCQTCRKAKVKNKFAQRTYRARKRGKSNE